MATGISLRSSGCARNRSLAAPFLAQIAIPIVSTEHRSIGAQSGERPDRAGHGMGRPYVPTGDVRRVRTHPVTKRPNMLGGTPEGQAGANLDSWEKLLSFFDRYLRRQ
jgi:hypothetical protein